MKTINKKVLLQHLKPPTGIVRMVLDTDAYNEIDDQFALVYALLSNEKLNVQAIYAAPFHNSRSGGPADGMERSYCEILRVLKHLNISPVDFVFRGSERFLCNQQEPCHSDAVDSLIQQVMSWQELLYVVSIGAPTNIASALLISPEIIERIVIVWLGGTAPYWPSASEFNLQQDLIATHILLDSGVPVVRIPTFPVTSHLLSTWPEIKTYVKGVGVIGDYLAGIFRDYCFGTAKSKVIWDISAVAYLINPAWVPTVVTPSPILTPDQTWRLDPTRHPIRTATYVDRDKVFEDFFRKLERCRVQNAAKNKPKRSK